MIRAKDFSYTIARTVIDKIVVKAKETNDYKVDFSGTVIPKYSHEKLAEAIVQHGILPLNIEDDKDRNKVEFHKNLLLQPNVETFEDFVSLFKKRFPEGTVCIIDESLVKTSSSENQRKIIMIDKYNDKNGTVFIKKYLASLVQPLYFKKLGYNNSKLFTVSEIDLNSLYNKEFLIDFPRNENEKKLLDILFCEGNNCCKNSDL